MKDYFYLNSSKMVELATQLTGAEIKMLYGIMYCLSSSSNEWFINNESNRAKLAEVGFNKAPERLCGILGALVKKGVLKREAQGVYSLPEGLYVNANKVREIVP